MEIRNFTIAFGLTFATWITAAAQSTLRVDVDDPPSTVLEKAASVVPSPVQLSAMDNEFIAFIHFGPNTFNAVEWGTGKESPAEFNPEGLDTDQWCEAMSAAGMKMAILTAKHHDGFTLWPSRYTSHGIMSSPFEGGRGDVMRDLSKSCAKYGIKLGVYLSPADLYQIESPEGLYGNGSPLTRRTIPRPVEGRPFASDVTFTFDDIDDYNEYFLNQLFELLTEYGPIHEVWFDGAHPKTKGGQKYNYAAWRKLIRALAPEAAIFGREDVRWCGNEGGYTRAEEWNCIPYPDDPGVMNEFMDLYGDLGTREALLSYPRPFYIHYQPAETNTSIRDGWFYRDDDYQQVRTADNVFDIYERAVGGNSIFLLNIPPDRAGRFGGRDVEVLREVGRRIRSVYGNDLLKGGAVEREDSCLTVTLPAPVTLNRLAIMEPVEAAGERVESFTVEAVDDGGDWRPVARGANVGRKRIARFAPVTTSGIRVRVTASRLAPAAITLTGHYYPPRAPELTAVRDTAGLLTIKARPSAFTWRGHSDDSGDMLNMGYKAYYTIDGSEPDSTSLLYTGPVEFPGGRVKAVAYLDSLRGETFSGMIGLSKHGWTIVDKSGENWDSTAAMAIDEDPMTYWQTHSGDADPFITISLGKPTRFNAIGYTPQLNNPSGHLERSRVMVSDDGKEWSELAVMNFGNLINNPVARTHHLGREVTASFIKIIPIRLAGDKPGASIASIDLYEIDD